MPANSFERPDLNFGPELARKSPELFRNKILEALRSETALGGSVWEKLCKRKQTAPERLKFDPDTWVSISHATSGELKLGVGLLPDQLAERLIFEDWNFRGSRQYVYRLSHEVSHLVTPKLMGVFNYKDKQPHSSSVNLLNSLAAMRRHGQGMSTLGSLDHYKAKGSDTQAVEDHTELVNMFLIDPSYFSRYLSFLANSRHQDFRSKNNLTTLTPETSRNIAQIIKSSVEFFLDDDRG